MFHRAPQPLQLESDRHGFTLVELLVALVIAVLIAAVLVTLYGTATRTVSDQQARAAGPHAASSALDMLADDLARAILYPVATNEYFVLENGGTNATPGINATLSFCTLDAMEGGDPEWTGTRHVTYRVDTEGQPTPALVRVDYPLTGPGSIDGTTTNVMVRDVDTFHVVLFDGLEWQSSWVGKADDVKRPKMARVVIGSQSWPGSSPTQQADLIIPAGHSVTSRLVRQSSPAPK